MYLIVISVDIGDADCNVFMFIYFNFRVSKDVRVLGFSFDYQEMTYICLENQIRGSMYDSLISLDITHLKKNYFCTHMKRAKLISIAVC